ncbi:hypothetical protein JTE90_018838 [Oedothorax gibbosus]|uniref:Uncharacterized protein n=1 Tax=Oedothorax gibbosus TaxID=931172 RepID=A0AAV6UWQ7_9ARAC|nr:hypothetical protein JTE90_018838 [Oedothorax gibbosus]
MEKKTQERTPGGKRKSKDRKSDPEREKPFISVVPTPGGMGEKGGGGKKSTIDSLTTVTAGGGGRTGNVLWGEVYLSDICTRA